jgi:hypothetical protein
MTVKAIPTSATIFAGSSAGFTLKVKPGTGHPKLSVAGGLPTGASASFKTKPPKIKTGPATSRMTLKTSASTPVGSYTIRLKSTTKTGRGRAVIQLTVKAPGIPPPSALSGT